MKKVPVSLNKEEINLMLELLANTNFLNLNQAKVLDRLEEKLQEEKDNFGDED